MSKKNMATPTGDEFLRVQTFFALRSGERPPPYIVGMPFKASHHLIVRELLTDLEGRGVPVALRDGPGGVIRARFALPLPDGSEFSFTFGYDPAEAAAFADTLAALGLGRTPGTSTIYHCKQQRGGQRCPVTPGPKASSAGPWPRSW